MNEINIDWVDYTYYCQVCKKAVAKQVLASDGTLPFEDIAPNMMTGLYEFICDKCDYQPD